MNNQPYANPDALVSTEWLAAHLNDANIRIIESNEDPLLYSTGHIPGAVNIDWVADLNDPLTRDYLDAGRFTALMNANGIGNDTTVIFYGDKITMSMQRTMDETNRRRAKQIQYNTEHNITPTTIVKSIEQVMKQTAVLDIKGFSQDNINIRTTDGLNMVAEPNSQYETIPQMEKAILQTKKQMEKMAKTMDFIEAAKLRDEMFRMELQLEKMKAS